MNVTNNLPIRIYPLSDLEFEDISTAKAYFEFELKDKCGKFHYRNKPIVAEAGTIVLFQYDQHIIAQAKLLKVDKYDNLLIDHGVEYHGHFLFDIDSIHYYNEALNSEEFNRIYPDKPLSRVTHILDDKERNSRLLKKLTELQF